MLTGGTGVVADGIVNLGRSLQIGLAVCVAGGVLCVYFAVAKPVSWRGRISAIIVSGIVVVGVFVGMSDQSALGSIMLAAPVNTLVSIVSIQLAALAASNVIWERRQFTLRKLFLVVAICSGTAAFCGHLMNDATRDREIGAGIRADVFYDMYGHACMVLARPEFADRDLELLSQLRYLTHLELRDCSVSSDGIRRVSLIRSLTFLDVRGVMIERSTFGSLRRLQGLRELRVTGGGLLPQDIDALRKSLPDCCVLVFTGDGAAKRL